MGIYFLFSLATVDDAYVGKFESVRGESTADKDDVFDQLVSSLLSIDVIVNLKEQLPFRVLSSI